MVSKEIHIFIYGVLENVVQEWYISFILFVSVWVVGRVFCCVIVFETSGYHRTLYRSERET